MQQLSFVGVEVVEKALGKAEEAGIVSLNDRQIKETKERLEDFARETRRAASAPGALSSFGDLLDKSGLADLQKVWFEDLYFAHRGEAAELWREVRTKNISEARINGLRLHGKLAYLTLNNANLVGAFQQDIDSPDDLARMVEMDLYQSDAWKTRLNAMAEDDDEELKKIIPPAYVGEKADDRLDAYAADLAQKVRLSFPTQVVGRMIENDDLDLGEDHNKIKKHRPQLYPDAGKLGFHLGRTPVDTFIR